MATGTAPMGRQIITLDSDGSGGITPPPEIVVSIGTTSPCLLFFRFAMAIKDQYQFDDPPITFDSGLAGQFPSPTQAVGDWAVVLNLATLTGSSKYTIHYLYNGQAKQLDPSIRNSN